MQITVLAAQIGWERSRVSHHVRRMSARGLVTCGLSAADRRVTEVTLTARGRQALEEAAPGHVDLVRRLFFGGLPPGLVNPLTEALESVYANIIKQGSLPPPVDWPPEDGLTRPGPAASVPRPEIPPAVPMPGPPGRNPAAQSFGEIAHDVAGVSRKYGPC